MCRDEDLDLEQLVLAETLERSLRLTNTLTLRLQALACSLDGLQEANDRLAAANATEPRGP